MATAYAPTEYGTLEANAPEDVSIGVIGRGEPDAMAMQSVGGMPSVDTSGSLLPPEAAPPVAPGEAAAPAPAAPGEAGPLTDMWDPVQRSLLETYDLQKRQADQLAEEQRAALERARAQLEYGYQRYADAGQEAVNLAEQQRLARPPLKTPPVEPAVPQQRFEPFGVGPEKETGMQALQRITMTLGLIAQMGMGMKSGYTRGAMASFSGAMEGWAKGQQIKGDQEWREYLANVQKMDREWAKERQYQDDILKRDAVDLDRAKLKMAIRQTELGYSKELVNLTLRDADQRLKMFDIERDMLQALMKNSMTVTSQRMLNDFKNRQQIDLENFRRQSLIARDLEHQLNEQKAQAAIALGEKKLAEDARQFGVTSAETKRHNIEMEKLRAAGSGGVQAREAEQAAQMSRDAINGLAAIYNDDKQKAVVDKWIGPTGPLWKIASENLSGAPSLGMVPQLPPEVVAANKYIADLTLHTRKLLSGRAVTQYEGKPLLDALPTIKDQPDVFWQKAAMSETNVSRLEKAPVRDPTQPMTWDPMTTPVGAAKVAAGPRTGSFATPPPLSATEYKDKWYQEGDAVWKSDGKRWIRQQRTQ